MRRVEAPHMVVFDQQARCQDRRYHQSAKDTRLRIPLIPTLQGLR